MSDETTPETPAAPEAAPEAPQAPAAQSVSELPDWAQKLLTDVRGEAAKYRTEAKTAAEQAQAEITDRIAKAFGLKEEAAADPEALTKSLTQAQQAAADNARKLAIFQAASTVGADPNRLLDSNSFMTSVAGLDPNDGAAVQAAIRDAIASNPLLKAVQAAAASGTELGGSGEKGQITEQQLAAMTPEEKYAALREGKLAHLLA